MTTPKDNMISQIWGLKIQPITSGAVTLTPEQSGTLFTNTGSIAPIVIELPAINSLRADKFIQPFYFSPTITQQMEISINSTPGSDRILIPDFNNNIIKPVVTINNIVGDSGFYNTNSVIGLYPAKNNVWALAHITGVWNALGYGLFDGLGLRGQTPIIVLSKNANQAIGWNNPVAWTDVIWETEDVKLYFQHGAGSANITSEVSGLADIYVNLEHAVDADGANDGTSARILVNGSEIRGGKNTLPEYSFLDAANMRRHLKIVAPDVSLVPGDIIKVQAADNATSGNMTIYNTNNTYIRIKYKR